MKSQEFAPGSSRGRRPGPWRWLFFVALALLFAFWAGVDLLPRLAGGLLGRGDRLPGGSAVDWDAVEVVWDPSGPVPAPGDAAPPAGSSQSADESSAEGEPTLPSDSDSPAPAVDEALGGGARPPGESGPAAAPGLAKPGEGDPAGESRRSPRILYSEWPRRQMLMELERSGRLRFRLRVEADGHVGAWELLDDGGFDCRPCRREAERIIASLRFSPGTLGGRPVACWVPYEISFERQ